MPLEYACIMPHGGDIIPQLAARKTKHLFVKTRGSMRKIARDIREVRPDTIVIASPHNLRLQDKIGIMTSENTTGQLNGPRGKKVNLRIKRSASSSLQVLIRLTRTRGQDLMDTIQALQSMTSSSHRQSERIASNPFLG